MMAICVVRVVIFSLGLASILLMCWVVWREPLDALARRLFVLASVMGACGVGLLLVDVYEVVVAGQPMRLPWGVLLWSVLFLLMLTALGLLVLLRNRRDGVGWVKTRFHKADEREESQ